ncbi:inositol monophosphatase family protein [Canibacter zhoujuaniae]|uniref:inositol monophosphatase family protein n=1 Tax=Canibacter zhoujuaniae TaxID=2708343 RepID=UPI00141D7FDB|nr:inositol monophosphatase family protein [Canibacter zhoujuaniae]
MNLNALSYSDLTELRSLAERVARDAGTHVRNLREKGVTVAAAKSSPVDIVTLGDQAAEQIIVAELRDWRHSDAILGEEGTNRAGASGITWILDPIDGTTNYFYNQPNYCVSVAACVADTSYSEGYRAVAGAVYVPTSAELFSAAAGLGATLNGKKLRINEAAPLSESLIATGFGYSAKKRARQAEVLLEVLPRVRDIRRSGSAAYDLCALAAGRLDAYYEAGLKVWDYAAAELIAREAGATVTGAAAAGVISSKPGTPLLIAGPAETVKALQPLLPALK